MSGMNRVSYASASAHAIAGPYMAMVKVLDLLDTFSLTLFLRLCDILSFISKF